MSPYQQPNCVYCRENIPHGKHVTALEYAKLFMEDQPDAHRSVPAKSGAKSVVKSAGA